MRALGTRPFSNIGNQSESEDYTIDFGNDPAAHSHAKEAVVTPGNKSLERETVFLVR